MKKLSFVILALAAAATAVSCAQKKAQTLDKNNYANVVIEAPDLSGISENGKEVLNLYKFAARQVDSIYASEAFYPEDMTTEEFSAMPGTDKLSPYTLIQRNGDGVLEAVWYHNAYKARIDTIANCLEAAAALTIKPSVRNYLLKKIDALRSDNYYESDIAWLEMDDSKMDLVIGPDESVRDKVLGVKKSYEAFVLLKDLERTEMLRKYASNLDSLQKTLPCKDEYKTFVPGSGSNIFACNALYYGGSAADGVKVIGINLPFDERVQTEKGSRSVLFGNVIDAKFNEIISPVANVTIEQEQYPNVDRKAFFWNTVFREVAHGLGVKQTLDGRSVEEALGVYAPIIEEIKAYIVGLYLSGNLGEAHELNLLTTKGDTYVTFLASTIRSTRFGAENKMGISNIIIYNYLLSEKAVTRSNNGKYTVHMAAMQEAVKSLAEKLLTIQAEGDKAGAAELVEKYSKVGRTLEEDFMNLRLAHVPEDINFVYNY